MEPIWKNSYGRGFLYERAVAVASKQKLFYWRPGDALPDARRTAKTALRKVIRGGKAYVNM